MTCFPVEPTNSNSELETGEINLSDLVESIVDSDDEDLPPDSNNVDEDLPETNNAVTLPDNVKEILRTKPRRRSEKDIEILVSFTQQLRAFNKITPEVRKTICKSMVYAIVDESETIIIHNGEELDSWSTIIKGYIEIEYPNKETEQLHVGDSFGVFPSDGTMIQRGWITTKCDDCQFLCIIPPD